MSGGVDSSVVAALLTIALGVKQTIGITMPSQFNSDETINIAENVAKKLGIEFLRIPIKQIADINIQLLLQHLKSFDSNLELEPILVENIQAKIRGTTILSNVAAQLHAFFTNNGNKVEIATGYATLYGDVGGAIAPIGDLTKTEVFQLAQFLNEEVFHTELIPNSLLPNKLYNFDIPPTAELKDAQIDPFKWGYHDALLEALVDYRKKTAAEIAQWYLEGTLHKNLGIPVELIMRWELDRPQLFIRDLEWFISKIQNNVFKRIQSPPIIILSKSAFGFDIRESQLPFIKSEKYKLLKKKILNLNSY